MTPEKLQELQELQAVFSVPRPHCPDGESESPEFIRSMGEWRTNRRKAFEALQFDPRLLAIYKLRDNIATLKDDPEINVNQSCIDLLELIHGLLDQTWQHYDMRKILAPFEKMLESEKSKKALSKKQEKKNYDRNMYSKFLDEQENILDTARLAARLKKAFEIKTDRVALDEVRRWKKKLRAAGKT